MRVAAIITNYNYARYLGAALDSVLAQVRVPDQIIVVDDGSTDDSMALLERRQAADARIEVIRQDNAGQLAAFIRGVAAADADWLFFLDADDLWTSTYVEQVLARVAAQPELDFVYTNLEFFGERSGLLLTDRSTRDLGLSPLLGAYQTRLQGSATSALSLRRSLAEKLLDLPTTMVARWRTRADDCLICGADILGAHKFYLAEPLVRYRAHDANAWLNAQAQHASTLRHWLRADAMLEFYRRRANLRRRALCFAKHEFRTKPTPTFTELRAYWSLLSRASLPFFKRMEHRLAMLGHYLRSR